MVKVIAQYVGFYGGRVHNIGDEFEVINEEWADENRRPKWVKLVEPQEPKADGDEKSADERIADVKNRDKKKG